MRCPQCNFVSFDDLDQCKKCGFDLVAFREGKPQAKPSWFGRLRKHKESLAETAEKEEYQPRRFAAADEARFNESPDLPSLKPDSTLDEMVAHERLLREEISRRQREYNTAPEKKVAELGRRLDALKREKLALSRRIEQAEEARRREGPSAAKATAVSRPRPDESASWSEKRPRPEKPAPAAPLPTALPQHGAPPTVDLAPILEAQKKIHAELNEAQRAKEQIQRELEEARRERERLTAEMRRTQEAKTREEAEAKALQLRQQQEEVGRLRDERRLLSEASEKLQEERERLSREREAVEREKQEAAEVQARAQELVEREKQAAAEAQARAQELVEREKQAAAEARAHALELLEQAKKAQPEPKPEPKSEPKAAPEPARPTTTFRREVPDPIVPETEDNAGRSIARAEDVLAHLAAPRVRERRPVETIEGPLPPAASPGPRSLRPAPRFTEVEEDADALSDAEEYPEELLEEEEEDVQTPGEVIPKGGLLYRGLAVTIDFLLLLLVLGLFLVIGRLVSGSKGGDTAEVVRMLGLPFYILFMLLSAAYFTYFHGASGQTIGKRLLRLQVFTTHGEPIGYLTAFFRFVAACFALTIFGMGFFWIALDPNKQGWHDKISRTVVIRL